jgi:hypothetical protein
MEVMEKITDINGRPLQYVSESEFPVNFSDLGATRAKLTPELAFNKLEEPLSDGVFEDIEPFDELMHEGSTGNAAIKEIREWLGDLGNSAEDRAWAKIGKLVTRNLREPTYIRIADPDSGLCAYAFAGKTKDGHLVAVHFAAVET